MSSKYNKLYAKSYEEALEILDAKIKYWGKNGNVHEIYELKRPTKTRKYIICNEYYYKNCSGYHCSHR